MKLVIATPVRGAELSTALVTAGYMDFRVRCAHMPEVVDGFVTFSLDVVRARNRIVGQVLATPGLTHVLWVDDDTYPERIEVVREMVELSRDFGIVAAPYTNKVRPVRWTHRVGPDQEVLGVGLGFTLTTVEMLRTMAEHAQWYTDLPRGNKVPDLFGQIYGLMQDQQGVNVEVLLSEDYSFCDRARTAGWGIKLHLGAGLIHHAGGHVWDARELGR